MKLLVKSNNREIEMSSEVYNSLSNDRKLSYKIIDKTDAAPLQAQVVINQAPSKPEQVIIKQEPKKQEVVIDSKKAKK